MSSTGTFNDKKIVGNNRAEKFHQSAESDRRQFSVQATKCQMLFDFSLN